MACPITYGDHNNNEPGSFGRSMCTERTGKCRLIAVPGQVRKIYMLDRENGEWAENEIFRQHRGDACMKC